MKKKHHLGKLLGLDIYLRMNIFVTGSILAVLFSLAAVRWLPLSNSQAVIFGIIAASLHYDFEFWHQYSHARAAKKTCYPMEGLLFFTLFAMSLYPRDEPELPAEIHLTRAFGGPIGSFALSLVFAAILLFWPNGSGVIYYLVWFGFLSNFGWYTVGALIPLGFNDGSTILEWWPKRGQS